MNRPLPLTPLSTPAGLPLDLDEPFLCPSDVSQYAPLSAPIVPAAYWISQGYDEPTAYSMERFQCQLGSRKFIYGHVIYLEPASPNLELVPHHEMLKYHWKTYMKNLKRGRAKAFFIEKFELQPSLDVIVPSLMQMGQLGELGLCNCHIDRNGLLLISKYLSRNTTLKRLLVNQNLIQDVDVAQALSSAVKNHPKMEELCISNCNVGENADVLPEILKGCEHLKILRLSDNNIGSANATHIGKFLAGNPNMISLRLDKNLLSDADACHIVTALTMNSNLHYLYLKGNAFTDDGKKEMMTPILNKTSLNSIAESNHGCEIVHNEPVAVSHINEKFWSTKRKVQNKIILALYGMDNDIPAINYFKDVQLELIPYALALIQKELDCLVQYDSASFQANNEPRTRLRRVFCFLRDGIYLGYSPMEFIRGGEGVTTYLR